jgi:hypothetical protein
VITDATVPWLKHINDLLGQYPHIVSALEALSTFAAVVVSLVIALWAQRANRTKLIASMFVADLVMEGLQTPPQYVTVSITNTGIMPLRIPLAFLYWKLPLVWGISFLISPLDFFGGDPYVIQKSYPVEIPPRANEHFHVGTPELQRREMLEAWKHYRWRLYFLRRFIRFKVETEDGQRFRVKISKDIRDIMREKPV